MRPIRGRTRFSTRTEAASRSLCTPCASILLSSEEDGATAENGRQIATLNRSMPKPAIGWDDARDGISRTARGFRNGCAASGVCVVSWRHRACRWSTVAACSTRSRPMLVVWLASRSTGYPALSGSRALVGLPMSWWIKRVPRLWEDRTSEQRDARRNVGESGMQRTAPVFPTRDKRRCR